MSPTQKKTFYLYGIGRSTEQLCFGHLVMKDYANPTQGLYSPFPKLTEAELGEYTHSTPFRGLIARSHESGFGPTLQLPDIAEATLQFRKSKASAIFASSGRRIELRNPEEFLREKVLNHPPTRKNFLAWVTAADSALVRAKSLFRRPKIWFLTGLHELVDACVYDFESSDPSLTLGVGSGLLTALAGFPIGASFEVMTGVTATSTVHIKGPAVWTAQWQCINVRYFWMSHEQQSLGAPHIQLRLLRDDTFTRGTLLADNERPNAVEVTIDGIDDDADAHEEESDETYVEYFRKALEMIQEDAESDQESSE